MWITCGQHYEYSQETKDPEGIRCIPHMGSALGGCRGIGRGRLEQRSRPHEGSHEAVPRYANGRLCGLRGSFARLSHVNHRTFRIWSSRKDTNRVHQGEKGPVGTLSHYHRDGGGNLRLTSVT